MQGTSRTHCLEDRHVVSMCAGHESEKEERCYVKAFENAIKFGAAPWLTVAKEFGAQGIVPKGQVAEKSAVCHVIRRVPELLQRGDES